MSHIILGIAGFKGSGKSTASAELRAIGFTNVKFAAGLKAMLGCLGLNGDHLEGNLKEVPCDLLEGQTPRWAMQALGAEWGRNLIGPDLWINHWKRTVLSYPEHIPICVDDLRYPNEQAAITELGGKVLYIDRGYKQTDSHSSEDLTHLTPNYVVDNTSDIPTLLKMIRQVGFEVKGS